MMEKPSKTAQTLPKEPQPMQQLASFHSIHFIQLTLIYRPSIVLLQPIITVPLNSLPIGTKLNLKLMLKTIIHIDHSFRKTRKISNDIIVDNVALPVKNWYLGYPLFVAWSIVCWYLDYIRDVVVIAVAVQAQAVSL